MKVEVQHLYQAGLGCFDETFGAFIRSIFSENQIGAHHMSSGLASETNCPEWAGKATRSVGR